MKHPLALLLVVCLGLGCVAVPTTRSVYITGPTITDKDGRTVTGRTVFRIALPKQDEAASFKLAVTTNGMTITGTKINAANDPNVISSTAAGQAAIIDSLTKAFEAGLAAAAKAAAK